MDVTKIAPSLLNALSQPAQDNLQAKSPQVHPLGLTIKSIQGQPSTKQDRAIVFVETQQAPSHHEGLVINNTRRNLCTGIVPLAEIGALSEEPWVKRLHATHRLRPLMDLALPACGIPAWRSAHAPDADGRGVVVGIVDTGLDTRHPAFAGRVHKVWDQTLSSSLNAPYGRVLDGPNFVGTIDTNGHGTHVAGIAAGDDPRYGGVAPGAKLVIVKTDFNTGHIADGISWIFQEAEALGMPAVVNLSLGGHADPHDGTDELSRWIEAESGPGRIVCCAAGNEGQDNIHSRVRVPAGGQASMRIFVPHGLFGASAYLNAWYDGRVAMRVSLRDPSGAQTPFQAVQAQPQTYTLPRSRVLLATPGPDPDNQDHSVQAALSGRGADLLGGVWHVLFQNPSPAPVYVDAWVLDDQQPQQVFFAQPSASDSRKVGSPGAAQSAITVASWTTRSAWTDAQGNGWSLGAGVGDISDFSSEGPLRKRPPGSRTNTRKPDLAAPGSMIAAAMSSHASPDPAYVLDAEHMLLQGTSMATPVVTGTVALMLQRSPTLDPRGMKQQLFQRCSIPGRAQGAWDRRWGRGMLRL